MANDELRDNLAAWLRDHIHFNNGVGGSELADALLAFLETQPPIVSDETAEALRVEWAIIRAGVSRPGKTAADERSYYVFHNTLRILGLLDVVQHE